MTKIIASPTRYIQGKGELKNLLKYASTLGNKALVIVDANIQDIVLPDIKSNNIIEANYVAFGGECCMSEINRIIDLSRDNSNVIIGVGGGKTLDTSKSVAYYSKKPVVIVPTIASTDAPCSSLSVIYTDDGVFEKYLYLPKSPDMVVVDTEVVSKAPVRLLVAGIGDAMATYFEARACYKSNADNCVGGKTTKAAMSLARLCYDTLLEEAKLAVIAMNNKVCTKAVEDIIEANTYLSGIGFESAGLAGAHAIHNGLTAIKETHKMYHGEKVAFGTLVQLVLENAPREEIEEVLNLCNEVGLPTTLEDLGVIEIKNEEIKEVARLSCLPNDTINNMPFKVTVEDVYNAIMGANEIGKEYKNLD